MIIICSVLLVILLYMYIPFCDSGRNIRFYCLLAKIVTFKQITNNFLHKYVLANFVLLLLFIKKTRNLCFKIRQSTSALNIWNSFVYNLGMQCISIIVGGVSTGESLTHPIIHMEIYYMCYTSTTTQLPPV